MATAGKHKRKDAHIDPGKSLGVVAKKRAGVTTVLAGEGGGGPSPAGQLIRCRCGYEYNIRAAVGRKPWLGCPSCYEPTDKSLMWSRQ